MNRIVLKARLIILGTGGLPKILSDWSYERVIREQVAVGSASDLLGWSVATGSPWEQEARI